MKDHWVLPRRRTYESACSPRWLVDDSWWLWGLLLASMVLFTQAACATKEARVVEADSEAPLPEVAKITFVGNTQFSSRTLRKQMVTQQRPLVPPWGRGEPYNPATVEGDLRLVQKYYFDRGFLETTVRLGKVQLDPEARRVRLEIVIDEGSPTLVSAVHITGTIPPELPPVQELHKVLSLRLGKPINKADFDRSMDLLLTRLRDASYARADVVPQTEVDTDTHTAVVTFELVPGARTAIGHITIAGRQRVTERAIRRQLSIEEGQPYSAEEITTSETAIYGLGAFQAVTPHLLNLEETGTPIDVAFQVREQKPHTVQVGVGFSSVERFRLQVEWLHRNLFGDAEQLRLTAKVSSIVQEFKARLHLPYFLAKRTTFTQTLFGRNEQDINTDPSGLSDALFNVKPAHSDFYLLSIGSETRVAHKFTRTLSGAIGLELSQNTFRHVNPIVLAEEGGKLAEDNLLFVQFAEGQWNTSDNLLNPAQGVIIRSRLEHSNTALLSDVSFAKLLLEARHYQRLWGPLILANRLKVGTIQPYGSSAEVPFNVRFLAGGPGSVRGFALNRLGPVSSTDQPIGGLSLIEGSVELRFPIFGDLGGVVFGDFGNVFRNSSTYHLADLRYAVGPGVRYNTPIGPVRLDVGFLVDRRRGENFGRVELSIGQAF